MKKLTILLMAMLMFFTVASCQSGSGDGKSSNPDSVINNKENIKKDDVENKKDHIIGDWWTEIDFPQSDKTIVLNLVFIDKEKCVVSCTWENPNISYIGHATYRLDGNKLTITFLEGERIPKDNIFDTENVYDIKLQKNKLVILNCSKFHNVDLTFGRGFRNRGIEEITFQH